MFLHQLALENEAVNVTVHTLVENSKDRIVVGRHVDIGKPMVVHLDGVLAVEDQFTVLPWRKT